ncbi:hypothetical protein GRJ2_002939500 [Grus japonensis]|uniref:Endonuclease/exonuclease/phosphatase domain-containing protein n=1 Tax=Grus japonensis TaxID=30415 RepID=A0ABC9Y4U0_GRUJA
MVGVCYRPPKQDEEADEILYKQLGEVSQSLVLFLVGDFNLPDICWKYNTAEKKQSRRFLECVEDSFLTQLVTEPARASAPLDLLLANRGLVGDVMVGSHHSGYEVIEFLILGEVRSGVSRTATLDFRRAEFGPFRSLINRVPWEVVLRGKAVQEGWKLFKKEILKAQDVPKDEPVGKKTGLAEQRALAGTQEKNGRVQGPWKKEQATQEDYKDVVRLCTEKISWPKPN